MNDTLKYYTENAESYAARGPHELQKVRLKKFFQLLPAGGSILDFGSGGGHYALIMKEAGFEVDIWDASKELAEEAEKLTGLKAHIGDFSALDAEEAYDGIWASASLLHAQAQALPDILERIHKALKPKGIFHCSFKVSEADWTDSLGRHFCAMTRPKLESLLKEAGFDLFDMEEGEGVGTGGEKTGWLMAWSRKT